MGASNRFPRFFICVANKRFFHCLTGESQAQILYNKKLRTTRISVSDNEKDFFINCRRNACREGVGGRF